jgi:hypothetical protein
MKQLDYTRSLYQAWQRAIAANQLVNEFKAPDDDPEGRWSTGDIIFFGLKQDGEKYIYYAKNHTRNQPIYGVVEEKHISGVNFTCQFNGYRALRPGGHRRQVGRQPDIPDTPELCRFACQDRTHPLSLLVRTPLLQIQLQHFTWNAYYNAAPIDPNGHFLWIPSSLSASDQYLPHFPQRLNWALVDDSIRLFRSIKHTMVFFNSLHAGASVNHIHFQAISHTHTLPVESSLLVEKGDYALLKDYPAQGIVFALDTPSHIIFEWVDQFQLQNIPFNLMLVGQRIILIPRNINHEIVSEFPGNGLAALGMCGRIITVDRAAYINTNADAIRRALRKMTLNTYSALQEH